MLGGNPELLKLSIQVYIKAFQMGMERPHTCKRARTYLPLGIVTGKY